MSESARLMDFDAIIVGAGMGGGALAYRLTSKGYKVLMLERGLPQNSWNPKWTGEFAARVKAQYGRFWPTPFLIEAILHPLLRYYLQRISRNKIIVTSILEDSPSFENRIQIDRTASAQGHLNEFTINYQITSQDQQRLQASRSHYKKLFSPLKGRILKVAEDNSFLAHACGTCRMSENPSQGVTNSSGRVHGIKNLFVADASLFVTSASVNPALTVGALALKVAEDFINTLENRSSHARSL